MQTPGLDSHKRKLKPLHKIDDCHIVFKWGEKFLHFILDAHFSEGKLWIRSLLLQSPVDESNRGFSYNLYKSVKSYLNVTVFLKDICQILISSTHGCYRLIKFIYSEKATKSCEISNVDLSYIVTVKSTVEISQTFVAFSEYTNFNYEIVSAITWHDIQQLSINLPEFIQFVQLMNWQNNSCKFV